MYKVKRFDLKKGVVVLSTQSTYKEAEEDKIFFEQFYDYKCFIDKEN